MSRTSHRWHLEKCPHCEFVEKVQNRSYRYVAPDGVVGAVTGYDLGGSSHFRAGDAIYRTGEFRRTTVHRLASARKKGIAPYDA